MALAEHKAGSAIGYNNALCLTLGTGVGGGLIIGNSLYRGMIMLPVKSGTFLLMNMGLFVVAVLKLALRHMWVMPVSLKMRVNYSVLKLPWKRLADWRC